MSTIELWVETTGKKKQTMISGLTSEIIKKHISNIKHKLGCNGAIKFSNISNTEVMMLQGHHIDYLVNYLNTNLNIAKDLIIIRGL